MRCLNCGCENTEGSLYCVSCGAPLDNKESINEITKESGKGNHDIPKKADGMKIAIGALSAVLVIAIAVACVLFVKAKNENDAYSNGGEYPYTDENAYDYSDYDYDDDEDTDGNYSENNASETTAKSTTKAQTTEKITVNHDLAKARDYMKDAENALSGGDRKTAFDMAELAYKLCPKDSEIAEEYRYYESYLPYKFYDEKNVLSSKKSETAGTWAFIYYNSKKTSNNSKAMDNSMWVAYDSTAVSSGKLLYTLTYNLEYDYDSISGTYFVLEKSKNREQQGYFEIYGDGNKIYTSPKLGVNVLPDDFSINVKGVKTVTVKFYGETDFYSLNADSVSYGISDFVALKDLP